MYFLFYQCTHCTLYIVHGLILILGQAVNGQDNGSESQDIGAQVSTPAHRGVNNGTEGALEGRGGSVMVMCREGGGKEL